MALYDLHRSSALPPATIVATACIRFADRLLERRRARRTRAALSRLTVHQLRDIGLYPGDLARWR